MTISKFSYLCPGNHPSELPLSPPAADTQNGFWSRQYDIHWPGASFFHRGRSTMVPFSGEPAIQPHVLYFDGDLCSQDFVIIGDPVKKRYLLIGAVTAQRSLCYFTLHIRQKRFITLTITQPEILVGEEGEKIAAIEGSSWEDLLIRYAEEAAHRATPAISRATVANSVGYCTWYYSYHNVTESEFFDNLAALGKFRDRFPASFAQIDDGYQTHHGDWLSNNANWPTSLQDTAARITEEGFIPGIWTMPLLASTSSRLFLDQSDWFVTDKTGAPLIIPGWSPPPDENWACLDLSHPGAQDYLRHVYTTFYAMGFRYFKLDGIGLSYPQGQRFLVAETGISSFRTALGIIRESVKESVVLGCGGPYLPSLGLTEHSRMSVDTGKSWRAGGVLDEKPVEEWLVQDPTLPCLYNALTQTLQNWWMFDRWFRADPDVVMARDENSALSEGEARMSALGGIMTGVVFTSDHLDKISSNRIDLLGRSANLRLHAVRPVDYRCNGVSAVYQGLCQGRKALAVFNWQSSPQTWDLDALGLGSSAEEFLHPLGMIKGSITLAPHDAALLVLP